MCNERIAIDIIDALSVRNGNVAALGDEQCVGVSGSASRRSAGPPEDVARTTSTLAEKINMCRRRQTVRQANGVNEPSTPHTVTRSNTNYLQGPATCLGPNSEQKGPDVVRGITTLAGFLCAPYVRRFYLSIPTGEPSERNIRTARTEIKSQRPPFGRLITLSFAGFRLASY